jgi:drug/metabolite transporter (DMT)-like permease
VGDSRLGAACAVAAGITFGTLGIFSRLFYDEGGDDFTLLVLRICFMFVILAAVALARSRPVPAFGDAALSVLLGAATLGATACLLAGFDTASPGLVILLFYVYPLVVTVAAHFLFREELTRRRGLLLVVGMSGIALTVGIPDAATAAGIAWGLGAGACISIYILGGRHVMSRSVDSFQFVALSAGGALLALAPFAMATGVSGPPGDGIAYAACAVVISSVVPTLLFYFAVRRIGASSASRLATIEPVTAVVLSYVVLGDAILASQIAGGVLVVGAVVALLTPSATRPRAGASAPACTPRSTS